jgi:hypothetical protein
MEGAEATGTVMLSAPHTVSVSASALAQSRFDDCLPFPSYWQYPLVTFSDTAVTAIVFSEYSDIRVVDIRGLCGLCQVLVA